MSPAAELRLVGSRTQGAKGVPPRLQGINPGHVGTPATWDTMMRRAAGPKSGDR